MSEQPTQVFKSTGIKSWSPQDRPREKLVQHGATALSDAELLAILLRVGTRDRSAVALAKDIMVAFNNNSEHLASASIEQLTQAKGVGRSKAVTIMAAIELGRRCGLASEDEVTIIKHSSDAYQLMRRTLSGLSHEEFWIAVTNQSNRVIGKWRISSGGITSTVVDTRLILRKCLEHHGTGLLLFHNHPSAQLRPSDADKKLTKKIQEAANYFDIRVLDHVIVTKSGYFSFSDEGLLSDEQ